MSANVVTQLQVKSHNSPDEKRRPDKSEIDIVSVGDSTIGRFSFEPGWRWSECIKPVVHTDSCQNSHVGFCVSGRLTVERGGSVIARIDEPGALVGEMSVLTGSPNSATVRADGQAIVRVVADAMRFVMRQPEIGLHIATVLAQRLDATSAVLSALRSEAGTDVAEQSRLGRIVAALFTGKAGK